ncbi:MAG: S41 family peptidase [Bacteroidetes bacterium]|nr:MAG: S41 family peptidase [Bacteroidota bacterium]
MNWYKTLNRKVKTALMVVLIAAATFGSFSFADEYFEISKNIELFTSVYREVHTYYVDEVEPGKLMRTGIDAMLESLDPYTSFYSEAETEEYRFQITGQYGGIGATISLKGDYVIINEPYEGFPAAKADLRPGDQLISANGKSLKGLNTEEVSKVLKGTPNTDLKLVIKRHGKEMDKTLVREKIHVNNVPYYGMVNENTGYISLQNFRNDAGKEVANALIELKNNNKLTSVILDLRGNPGGLLMEAINVVNVFVPKNQLVVSTRGKVKEQDREYRTLNNPVDLEIPVVVLTSRGSASASEIVSGTIQDLDRGVVLGQRTFGKGLVQSTRPLNYGTQIKLTTQKYYTPSGRCIQALDYSKKAEDGSVESVPDSLKKAFKTKGGRTVYDGGGIDPDVKKDIKYLSKITTSLLYKNLLFDFAVEYRGRHEQIATARDFKLSEDEWNNFVKFLEDKDYAYQTETEKELEQLEAKAKKEGYYDAIKDNFKGLTEQLNHDKNADVTKNKAEIKEMIEQEIVRHYYHRKGRFEYSFINDEEIKSAIEVLNDQNRYSKLLKP